MKKLLSELAIAGILAFGSLESKAQSSVTPTSSGWTNDANVAWNWATQYLVQASSSGNGSVTGNTNDWLDAGTTANLIAAPSAHYHFAGWTGLPLGANTNLATNAVTVSTNFAGIANFSIDQVALTQTTPYSSPTWSTTMVNYGDTNAVSIGTATNIVNINSGMRMRRTSATLTGNQGTVNP